MLVAHNLQLRFIWPVRVVVRASELTRLHHRWSAEGAVHHSSAQKTRWRSDLRWIPNCGKQFSNPLSEARFCRLSIFSYVLQSCSELQSDSNWNLLETGLCQGSFINLRLTCKPSSLIPAAWKWETSMSFAAALMLSCCSSLGYQRYNQETSRVQTRKTICNKWPSNPSIKLNQWSTWKRILKVSTTMEQQPVWHLAAPQ